MVWEPDDRPEEVEENDGIILDVDGEYATADEDADVVSTINDAINENHVSDAVVDATYADGSKVEDIQPGDLDGSFREEGIIRLDIFAGKENA